MLRQFAILMTKQFEVASKNHTKHYQIKPNHAKLIGITMASLQNKLICLVNLITTILGVGGVIKTSWTAIITADQPVRPLQVDGQFLNLSLYVWLMDNFRTTGSYFHNFVLNLETFTGWRTIFGPTVILMLSICQTFTGWRAILTLPNKPLNVSRLSKFGKISNPDVRQPVNVSIVFDNFLTGPNIVRSPVYVSRFRVKSEKMLPLVRKLSVNL